MSGDEAVQAQVTAQLVEAVEGLASTVKLMLDTLDTQQASIGSLLQAMELYRERLASLEADRVPRP